MSARADPYVGLGRYGEEDPEWFFGREREVELITANLQAARLTLLYGAQRRRQELGAAGGRAAPPARASGSDREERAPPARGAVALAERPALAVALVRDWRDAPLRSVVRPSTRP